MLTSCYVSFFFLPYLKMEHPYGKWLLLAMYDGGWAAVQTKKKEMSKKNRKNNEMPSRIWIRTVTVDWLLIKNKKGGSCKAYRGKSVRELEKVMKAAFCMLQRE